MKKLFATILAAAIIASLAAGCGGAATSEAPSSAPESPASTSESTPAESADASAEGATIQILHGQPEEPRVKAIQQIIDGFMAANSGISVEQMAVPEDALWTKITTLISAGQLPGVIEGGVDQMRLMNSEEAIDPTACTETINAIGKDRYFAGALEAAKAPNGTDYVGVPVSGFVAGIWYRTDLFAEKGLPPPSKWEDITAAAQAFHDPANKMYGIVFATEETEFTEQTFTPFANSNDADLFDADGNPQFTSPAMKEAVEMYTSLYQYCLPGSNGFSQVKDTFLGGHSAMAMYSTYIMGGVFDAGLADQVAMAPISKNHDSVFGGVSTMTISSMIDEAQRAAAIKFLTYMGTPEANIIWDHMSPGGSNPVLKDVASDPKYLDQELLKAFGDTAKNVPLSFEGLEVLGLYNGTPHPAMGTISGKFLIPHCLNQIMVGGVAVDTAMADCQTAMEAEVAAVQ